MGIEQTGRIVTPFNEDRIYTFNITNKPVHVMEVPASRFQDLPICLATGKDSELAKLQHAVREFQRFYEHVATTMGGLKP